MKSMKPIKPKTAQKGVTGKKGNTGIKPVQPKKAK